MIKLLTLQQQLQTYFLTSKQVDLPIVATKTSSAFSRLNIYTNAYRIRLQEALASNYPCLYHYLDQAEFNRIAWAYIQANPSTHRSIRWFGDNLVNFLSQLKLPAYLVELAAFEWKMTLVFDALDCPVLLAEDLSAIPPQQWPKLTFTLHPSVQFFNAHYNTVALWQAWSTNQDMSTDKLNEMTTWIMWRQDYINRFYSLSDDERWAIQAIAANSKFADLCEGLCQWHHEEKVTIRAAALLKGWIEAGLLADVSY